MKRGKHLKVMMLMDKFLPSQRPGGIAVVAYELSKALLLGKVVERFTWANSAANLMQIYRRILR